MEKGRHFGILNAGYYALRTLRIEKMFAFWGQDLDKNTNPYECGREFRVKLETKDFIGKMALMMLKDKRVTKRFVQLLLGMNLVFICLFFFQILTKIFLIKIY